MESGPRTGIVVMVPEAEAIVPGAHITLLAPFGADNRPTPGEIEDAAALFADVVPFTYALSDVCSFPDGSRYLSPEPPGVFSRLIHRLHRLFPEYPPYGGAYDVVVPHLTIPDDAVVGPLPLTAYAGEAALLHLDGGELSVWETFPFGTTAA